MKHLSFFMSVLLAIIYANSTAALTTQVKVDKIRYCRTVWPICNDKLQDDYHWWEDHGVPDQIQKNTYIAKYNEPSRANVEHLVLLSAGQRFTTGHRNLITGQGEFSGYGKRDSHGWETIDETSIAYRLFSEEIYLESNTFMALAFDARFNWGFSKGNKSDIVDAYYAWLKSKVYLSNLKSVYLAGHSRGGALVLRIAQKFQQEMPHVAVIVHGFDPVVNRKEGELGAYNSSIDNPIAGFPRDTGGLNNKGNWSWKTDFREQYANKHYLSIFNFLSGGKIFGLAQEVRSVTHLSGTEETTDLAWYYQQWHDVSNEDGGGHVGIVLAPWLITDALAHVKDRLHVFLNNIAPLAQTSASSTFCASQGLHCYNDSRINDTNLDSRVGGFYSWSNSDISLPEWVTLTWANDIKTRYIELVTSEDFPLTDYKVQYHDGANWQDIAYRLGNNRLHVRLYFGQEIQTKSIRIFGLQGPSHQPQYVRVNEVLVVGDWLVEPNKAPIARCSASPSTGIGYLTTTLSASGSYDLDGTISKYQWNFSNGGSALGHTVTRSFAGDPNRTVFAHATVTVTDNEGATASARCNLTIHCEGDGLEEPRRKVDGVKSHQVTVNKIGFCAQ